MIDPDALNVWFESRLTGYLWRNPVGAIGFRYESDWINSGGFAVSRTLPLTTKDFSAEGSVAHRFFANLLPGADCQSTLGCTCRTVRRGATFPEPVAARDYGFVTGTHQSN